MVTGHVGAGSNAAIAAAASQAIAATQQVVCISLILLGQEKKYLFPLP